MSTSRGRGSKTAGRRFRTFLRATSSSRPHDTPAPESSGGSTEIGDSIERVHLDSPGDRGSTQPDASSRNALDKRIQIIEVSKSLLALGAASTAISSAIGASFRKYVCREGVAWRLVTQEYIDTYWDEFKKQFRWEPPLTDDRVYELFLKRAGRRYSDWVADIKKERRTKGRQPFLTEDTWAHWCAHWDTEAVKGRSEIMKKNRLSEPDGPGTCCGKHRGGSKSAVSYAYEMAREQNVPLQQVVFPTFQRLHYSKSEASYTSGKAKRIADEVESQLADMSQGLPDGVSPTPEDVAEIFVSVAGDPVKNRIFGLGSLNNAQATSSYGDSSSVSPLQPKLDEALARLEAERESRIEMERRIADHESQIVREREEFERRMQEKLAAQEVQFTSKLARTEERIAVQQDMLEQLFRERRPPP